MLCKLINCSASLAKLECLQIGQNLLYAHTVVFSCILVIFALVDLSNESFCVNSCRLHQTTTICCIKLSSSWHLNFQLLLHSQNTTSLPGTCIIWHSNGNWSSKVGWWVWGGHESYVVVKDKFMQPTLLRHFVWYWWACLLFSFFPDESLLFYFFLPFHILVRCMSKCLPRDGS